MPTNTLPGGTFALADDITVTASATARCSSPAPHVFGPPADRDAASPSCARRSSSASTTSTPATSTARTSPTRSSRRRCTPIPSDLHIVTKVGAKRDAEGGWPHGPLARASCTQAVHDNLEHLGLDALDVVNLRMGGVRRARRRARSPSRSRRSPSCSEEGLIRHLGVSTVSAEQVAEAHSIAPVVCVQNLYNLAHREDDDLIDALAARGHRLRAVLPARRLLAAAVRRRSTRSPPRSAATPMAVALAWLLQRSPNILLIPGTSSVAHLRENVAGAGAGADGGGPGGARRGGVSGLRGRR